MTSSELSPRTREALREMGRLPSHGGSSRSDSGMQVYVNLSKGNDPFPTVVELRLSPSQTVGDMKARVQEQAGVAAEKQQLFWRGKELRSDLYDDIQLARLNLAAGTSFNGYDLNEEPVYWPEVEMTDQGLRVKRKGGGGGLKTRAEMGYTDGLSMQQAIAAYRGPGPPHAGGEQQQLGSSLSSTEPPPAGEAETCPNSAPPLEVEGEEKPPAVDEVSIEEQLEQVMLEDEQAAKANQRKLQMLKRTSKYR